MRAVAQALVLMYSRKGMVNTLVGSVIAGVRPDQRAGVVQYVVQHCQPQLEFLGDCVRVHRL